MRAYSAGADLVREFVRVRARSSGDAAVAVVCTEASKVEGIGLSRRRVERAKPGVSNEHAEPLGDKFQRHVEERLKDVTCLFKSGRCTACLNVIDCHSSVGIS